MREFLKKEVARLKKEVDNLVYNEESFKDNDEKVVFFTGCRIPPHPMVTIESCYGFTAAVTFAVSYIF